MTKGTILVTGAAGFIGSHTVLELLNADYSVVAIDNFLNSVSDSNGKAISLNRVSQLTEKEIDFVVCDLLDLDHLKKIFEKTKYSAVIHLAALKAVGESVAKPIEYYQNNIIGFLNLIQCCRDYNVKEFIFSSSATVYGTVANLPILENSLTGQNITNPYGRSKYMIEEILFDVQRAESDWNISILRYFNPAGAHESGLIGEDPRGIPNNLMPYVAQVAAGKLPFLNIYGTNYDTPDGTGVRDFIHIVDLAKAHVAALKRIKKLKETGEKPRAEIYNVGTGRGYSVLEMVTAFEKACGHKLNTKNCEPRPGDLATVYCDPTLAEKNLGWKAKYGITEITRDLWNFQLKNPTGYSI